MQPVIELISRKLEISFILIKSQGKICYFYLFIFNFESKSQCMNRKRNESSVRLQGPHFSLA